MTDLRHIPAATIDLDAPLDAANRFMIRRGVRLLLVTDDERQVLGLITANDVLGEKPVQFALERAQGGAPAQSPVSIIEHPDVRRMLMLMRARVEALRALTLEAALQLDLAENHPQPEAAAKALGLSQWLLPICKACATDAGLDVANMAVQVFGGAGYVTDTGVEQYVRDVRVGSIYEGTNGIQAIDLVTRKLIADGAARCREFLAMIRASVHAAATVGGIEPVRQAVTHSADVLERVSLQLLDWSTQGRAADIEAGAVAYLRLAGLVGGGWMWLRMVASDSGAPDLNAIKRATALFYAQNLLPECELLARQATLGADAAPSPAQWQAGW